MQLIPLGHGKFAKVDDEDVLWLLFLCSWNLTHKGYAHGVVNKKNVEMHKLIGNQMGFDPKLDVDHKDRNRLNNQRCNLREATRSQTLWNRTGYGKLPKGVYLEKETGKYRAGLVCNGIRYRSTRFLTPEEAYTAYLEMARIHFGEFAIGD